MLSSGLLSAAAALLGDLAVKMQLKGRCVGIQAGAFALEYLESCFSFLIARGDLKELCHTPGLKDQGDIDSLDWIHAMQCSLTILLQQHPASAIFGTEYACAARRATESDAPMHAF